MKSLGGIIFLTVLSAASGVGGWEDGPDVGGEVGGGGGPGQPELAVAGRPPEAYGVILKNKHLNKSSNISVHAGCLPLGGELMKMALLIRDEDILRSSTGRG